MVWLIPQVMATAEAGDTRPRSPGLTLASAERGRAFRTLSHPLLLPGVGLNRKAELEKELGHQSRDMGCSHHNWHLHCYIQHPSLLLFDECSSNLDKGNCFCCWMVYNEWFSKEQFSLRIFSCSCRTPKLSTGWLVLTNIWQLKWGRNCTLIWSGISPEVTNPELQKELAYLLMKGFLEMCSACYLISWNHKVH